MTNDLVKSIWPEWKIGEKPIGRGSYGAVYKAVRNDHGVESTSAIKIISVPRSEYELDSLRSEGLDDDAAGEYLEKLVGDYVGEIRMLESFKGTQNIVSVEDYKVIERTDRIGWDILIRMELLTPLLKYAAGGELSEKEAIKLGTDICSALELLGKKNVIHRDIKPQNIFVNEFGDFKLGDFGIARCLEGTLSRRGTPGYMAPETVKHGQYDARSDIYSLGMVLYTAMNKGRLPFLDPERQLLMPMEREEADRRRLNGEELPPPCSASPAFGEIILRACAPDPDGRFSTPEEMKRELLELGEGKLNAAQSGAKKKKGKKKAAVIAAAALGALLLAGGITIAVWSSNRKSASDEPPRDAETGAVPTDTDASAPPYETEGTEPAAETAGPAEGTPYEVYLTHLKENKEAIDLYFWQKGFDGKGECPSDEMLSRPVAFADVWGDEAYEMIYFDAYGSEAEGYFSRLNIVTCLYGRLYTLCTKEWDSSGNGLDYALFWQDGAKTLYTVTNDSDESEGVEYRTLYCYAISGIGNKIAFTEYFRKEKRIGEDAPQFSMTGWQYSENEYNSGISRLNERIEEVLQFGGANSACESFVKKHGSTAMTSDEAEAWLEEQLRQDEEDTEYPFKITKTKEFLMGVSIYFQLYDNVSDRSIMLHVYLDGIVEGKYSKLGNEKYFSFRMDDLTAVNEDYCTFSVTGLTADAEIADVLKEAGVYEGREMRIYMTGCARSKLPRGAANAMNKLRDQDGINYLQFCIIYCEETESTYFPYGNFLSRIGRS